MSIVDFTGLLKTASTRGSDSSLLIPLLRQLAPSIASRAKRLSSGNDVLRESLESAGLLGVVESLRHFDFCRRVPLPAYAMQYAVYRMSDELRKEWEGPERTFRSIEEIAREEVFIAVEEEGSPLDRVAETEFEVAVDALAALLPPRHGYVFTGLIKRSLTQAQIARELGVSRTAVLKMVRQIQKQVRVFRPLHPFLEVA